LYIQATVQVVIDIHRSILAISHCFHTSSYAGRVTATTSYSLAKELDLVSQRPTKIGDDKKKSINTSSDQQVKAFFCFWYERRSYLVEGSSF
jgi:hypothetical protein